MNLHLYNSATRTVEPLKPVKPGHVGIYLCGATVQGSPHIGHMRSAVAFDTLIRWLKYNGIEVTYIRNITDIDDKILRKSAEANQPWWAWAAKFEREFAAAYEALGLLPPTFEPRATAHITDQLHLIERLMERGHAYADGQGNVYFDVHSLDDYGSLTRQELANMRTTEDESQIDAATEAGKKDPRDFALWKAWKPTEPTTAAWESPWGKGRPGWHLECSAMSERYLGETFDIHGGGIDLRFPHHENEQAQSHGAGWGFAQMWVHNAWVTLKGEKMSKSLGNSLLVADILETVPAPVLRFALGTVHHRSTVEYGEETIAAAQATWERFAGFVTRATQLAQQQQLPEIPEDALASHPLPEAFCQAMDDDLNVAGALAVIYEHLKAGNSAISASDFERMYQALWDVRAMLAILGLDPGSAQWAPFVFGNMQGEGQMQQALDHLVTAVIAERAQARAEKDWAKADDLRDRLTAAGIIVEDSPEGARWHLA
ncbi:cysteine--tRNA ligase [Gleimia sp. 6138-11-ORH1]|uniref:cysteine--tRNA ligase n=1 Tax=Gleimia sp. 6138-11-ORH1 TaxID=2973937 RepID=UPI00216A5438|nr:cysteine--tRNA ligase [Gleimia sp. 6138-11-ORH1]MCS4485028.1 cysteine--tRNA ligase [Gleimia sp. 6138-11-ORH1]